MGNSHHELPDLQFDLRLGVLFAAVTEIARVLPAQDAVQVATGLRGQVSRSSAVRHCRSWPMRR